MMYSHSLLLALLMMLFRQSQMQCIPPGLANHRKLREVLEKVVLHQEYARCSSLDTTYQHLVCEIWDEADETSLQRSMCFNGKCGDSYCASTQGSFTRCPDGSINKTCLPNDNAKGYTCACQSMKKPDACDDAYQWDSEWRNITSRRQGLFRQLCNQTTEQCVATEYRFGVAHLVTYIPLPDENISASSQYNAVHAPKRVRIDNYFDYPCAWVHSHGQPASYVQFDLPKIFVVLGVLIRARCDPTFTHQMVTRVNVQYSLNNAAWNYTSPLNAYPQYGQTASYPENWKSFTHFFEEAVSGQYWRIIAQEYVGYTSMKADLIGRV